MFSEIFKKFGVHHKMDNKNWAQPAWILGWRWIRELKTFYRNNDGPLAE